MSNTVQLTLSLAGKREHARLNEVKDKLSNLFATIGKSIPDKSVLRINLLTGLADGVDMVGAETFLSWETGPGIIKSLTAVIPFAREDYKQTIKEKARFELLYDQCNRHIILDGRLIPETVALNKPSLPMQSKNKAYRQQAFYLLTASDILLAVTDTAEPEKAGGTFETIKNALSRNIPVLLLSLYDMGFYLLRDANDLENMIVDNYPAGMDNDPEFGKTIFKVAGKTF